MSWVGTVTGRAIRGLEQVVGSQHQEAGLSLGLSGQRYVYRHLVAVEVSVERGTYQRMQLDGAALYQHRLETPEYPDGAA